MQELEPPWGRVMSVWWLLAWRSALGFVLFLLAVIVVASAVLGVIGAAMNLSQDLIHKMGYAMGFASVFMGAILSPIFVVRMALKKRYGDFRIALVPVWKA